MKNLIPICLIGLAINLFIASFWYPMALVVAIFSLALSGYSFYLINDTPNISDKILESHFLGEDD